MFMNYLLLLFMIIAAILTFASALVYFLAYSNTESAKRNLILASAGISFILFSSISRLIYEYLITNAVNVLVVFGIWYATGFTTRIILLFYNCEIFDSVFETDWEEVFFSIFSALLGPIQIFFLIKELTRDKS